MCKLLIIFLVLFLSPLHAKQPSIQSLESSVVKWINQECSQKRLKSLTIGRELSKYAAEHSFNRATGKIKLHWDGHTGFNLRAEAVRRLGKYCAFGENVAHVIHTDEPIKVIVEAWMKSYEHRKNILGDYDETGVGIAYDSQGRCFITQLFAKRQVNRP